MADPEEIEEEESPESEGEMFTDGEIYFPDMTALCGAAGAVALQAYEGGIFLYIPGDGAVPLADWCKKQKRGQLAAVK